MSDTTSEKHPVPRSAPPSDRQTKSRREFLRATVAGVGVTAVALTGAVPVLRATEPRLRPPGALAESDFLASCIKCGQCVQVCPVEAIELGDLFDGFSNGVPHVTARIQACDFSCDAVQCVLACPTGALTHALNQKEQTRMGMARLSRPEKCLARKGLPFKGLARGADFPGIHRYMEVDRWTPIPIADHPYDLEICDLCVRECPIKGAIELVPMSDDPTDPRRTPKINESCVGCGMCEMICPTECASIVVDANQQGHEA